jgi:hypothetical protein
LWISRAELALWAKAKVIQVCSNIFNCRAHLCIFLFHLMVNTEDSYIEEALVYFLFQDDSLFSLSATWFAGEVAHLIQIAPLHERDFNDKNRFMTLLILSLFVLLYVPNTCIVKKIHFLWLSGATNRHENIGLGAIAIIFRNDVLPHHIIGTMLNMVIGATWEPNYLLWLQGFQYFYRSSMISTIP